MRSARGVIALAVLTLFALPHSLVRGKAPPGKTQYYVCGAQAGCPNRTSKPYDPRNPEHCSTHDREMKYKAYEK
jgi:hypothetical protein